MNLPFFRARTPVVPKPDPAEEEMARRVGAMLVEVIQASAETLTKSCLYFTRGDLEVLGGPRDITCVLQEMDPLLRSMLLDRTRPRGDSTHLNHLAECASEIAAGADAAERAAQLFGLLRDAKTPAGGLLPLRKLTDSAVRALRVAALAVSARSVPAVADARTALLEAEAIAEELIAVLPSLASYRSPTLCRMMRASVFAVLVSAHQMVHAASLFVQGKETGPEALQPTLIFD